MIIVVIALIIIFTIPNNETDRMNIPFIIVVLVLFIGASIYRSVGRQKKILESYKLTIDENLIKAEQMRMPAVSIYFNEISAIIKNKKGSFDIKSSTTKDVIIIPLQIENYAEIESLLNKIKPITYNPETLKQPFLTSHQNRP